MGLLHPSLTLTITCMDNMIRFLLLFATGIAQDCVATGVPDAHTPVLDFSSLGAN